MVELCRLVAVMHYRRTQSSYVFVLVALVVLAIVAIVLGIVGASTAAISVSAVVLVLVVLVAAAFSRLTVEVGDGEVQVWFGRGWPRRSVALTDVADVRVVQNPWWVGYGIRKVRRGWMYNVSGPDSVQLELHTGRVFRVGTADPTGLLGAIEAERGHPPTR